MKTYSNSATNTFQVLLTSTEVKIQGGHVLFKNSNFCVSFLYQKLPRGVLRDEQHLLQGQSKRYWLYMPRVSRGEPAHLSESPISTVHGNKL